MLMLDGSGSPDPQNSSAVSNINLFPEVIQVPQHFRVYDQTLPHFITCTIVYWIPVFCREDYFLILSDNLKFYCEKRGLQVHAYVIMPNHFHAVCSQINRQLSAVIRDLKKFTSREIACKLEQDGRSIWLTAMRRAAGDGGVKAWDESFHPEQIHSKPFFDQKIAYLHNNPARAGYVSDPCEWKHSSAGLYYRNAKPLVPITPLEL